MANLCLNVLFDAYPNVEAAAASLYPYLDRTPNDAIHVTTGARAEQGFTFAKSVKSRYPKMDVIFRKLPDDNQHERMTPRQWFDSYAPWSDGGKLLLSNTNEPGTGNIAKQDQWMSQTLDLAGKAGIRVVTWNLQTHNRFEPHEIDKTLRMCARYRHPLGLHYYFDNENGFPIDPLHLSVQDYCTRTGIGTVDIYITELGYAWRLDPYAGYQGRLDGAVYGGQLATTARRYPKAKFFIYDWGRQSPWELFDISGDKAAQDKLVAYNQEQPPVPPTPDLTPLGQYRLADIPADWVNVRATPSTSGADLGDLRVGDVVTLYTPDSNGWVFTEKDALKGWVSRQNGAVTFEPVQAPAPSPYINGVDISQAQTPLTWKEVKAAGYEFAIIRATQGTATSRPVGADTRFRKHIDAALAAGADIGVYHNHLPEVNGDRQAEFYYTAIAPYLDRLSFPPAVDVETKNGQTPATISSSLHNLVRTLEALIGQPPMIYTSPGFWNANILPEFDAFFARCPLWIAHWTDAEQPILPRSWRGKDWRVWQWRVDRDGIPGYPGKAIDLNRRKP